ncbi:MAG: hypothetical protein ACM3WU_09195 [Bacillota bacterium]
MKRDDVVSPRLEQLASDFPRYVKVFDADPAFNKPGQFDYHSATIKARQALGSAAAAIDNDTFIQALRETLAAWGIGARGSRMAPLPQFCDAIRAMRGATISLDGLCIDDPSLDVEDTIRRLWTLIQLLDIVDNDTKLVACSKTLHHLLPDLVVPVDRQYTRVFFRRYGNMFQYGQKRFFEQAYRDLVWLAREVNPVQYVGYGWQILRTKVLDNALIAFCKENHLHLA